MALSCLTLSCLAQQQLGGQVWPAAVAPSAVVQDLHREFRRYMQTAWDGISMKEILDAENLFCLLIPYVFRIKFIILLQVN